MEKKKRTKKCKCGYVNGVFEPCDTHKAEIENSKKSQPIPSPFQDFGRGQDVKMNFVDLTGGQLPEGLEEALKAFKDTLEKKGGHVVKSTIEHEAKHIPTGTRGGFNFDVGSKGLGSISKVLNEYVNEFNCGNPDCPVHGHKNKMGETEFHPYSKEEFDKLVDKIREVAVEGRKGFIYVGRMISDPKPVPYSIGAMEGKLKVNQVDPRHILLSLIQQMKLTRTEAINLISDENYGTRPADPNDFK